MTPKYTLIAFATAWGPRFGGINAFNMDLLTAVAAAYWQSMDVFCVVADCSLDDIKAAKDQYQVNLVKLGLPGGEIGAEHEPLAWNMLQAAGCTSTADRTVWLGHDSITGAIANASAIAHGGRAALIHHMSYAHYESYSEDSATAHIKETAQKALFIAADVQLAVGPLLRIALADFIDKAPEQVGMLIPGLAAITPKVNKNNFVAFVSGRLDLSAQKIKQAHLGVAGFAHAVKLCDNNTLYPDALKGSNEPKLKLRGIEYEQITSADACDAETELKTFANTYAGRVLNLQALPFTQDRTELFDELRAASVCIMPSWHEGFGLVAWEAIAAGVPLIVGIKSGVYKFLKNQNLNHLVETLDVQAHIEFPYFTEQDKVNLAQLLLKIAKDPADHQAKALRLRELLLAKYQWRTCASQLVESFGWEATNLAPAAKAIAPSAIAASGSHTTPITEQSKDDLARWLKLPTPLWQPNSGLSPGQLLKAEEALVPFAVQRETFLDTQLQWAIDAPYPLCVRLLTGEGGSGKTRLAIEMCQRLASQGWHTGFLSADHAQAGVELAKVLALSQQPVLVVMDYAETRTATLLSLLENLSLNANSPNAGRKLRILLLARSSGDWWGQLPSKNPKCEALLDGPATTGPDPVKALYEDTSSRLQAFAQALGVFGQALGLATPPIQPDLSDALYGIPLYLQMAAMLSLLGEHTPSAAALPQALVRHEQRYWHQLAKQLSPTQPALDAEQAADMLMCLATLVGHAPTPSALENVWREAGGSAQQLKPLFLKLSPLYPAQQGLGGLRPDILGEALVSRFIQDAQGSQLLNAVLGSSDTSQRRHALTVVARALRQHTGLMVPLEKALTLHFARCAQDILTVSIQTPSTLPQIAERSFKALKPNQALQVAGLLENNFEHEVYPLSGLELLIEDRLHAQALYRYQRPKPTIENMAVLARHCNNLSISHSRQGDNTRALEFSKQALDIHERLAKDKPERFEPHWATSLNNYAAHLSDAGDNTRALEFAKQALDIHERLAKDKPERFEPDWAKSLSNYANHLSDAGDNTRALEFSKQALDIHERLAKDKHARFEPDWAMSLGNYANRLSDAGDNTRALEFAKQALDISERLAKDKSERFEPNWAKSLSNYANHLSDAGDNTRALEFSKQALEIRERLAQDKPERFEADLARSLGNYAIHWMDAGDGIQALVFFQRADAIHQRLVTTRPKKFLSDAKNTQIWNALAKWLTEDATFKLPEFAQNTQPLPYDMVRVEFIYQLVRGVSAEQPSAIADALNAVWAAWDVMSKTQKIRSEEYFYLACGLAQSQSLLPAAFSAWRAQLEAFKVQRKGWLPSWMSQVAQRKGFSL